MQKMKVITLKALLFSAENNNIFLSYFLPSFALAFLCSLLYNEGTKAREEKTMMIRSNKSRKFSVKYRIEKWFYEDSKKHLILALKGVGMFITLTVGFALIAIGPALFH